MRERLDELCAFDRESASDGELRAAEWLAGALRDEGVRAVRVEEEPEANGTYWWSIGLLAGAAALAGLAARRGGRAARLFAAGTGAAAAALSADELPPGRRRFRQLLPKSSAHHVLGELGPPDAERTIVLMAHHDAAHTAFFFNPAITEAVGESAPWVFEQNDTSPPLMWPVVGGPALVAAGALLGSRSLTGLGTFLSAGAAAFMAHIGADEVVPGANDNGTGCVAQLPAAAERDRRRLPAGGRLSVRLRGLLQPVEEPLELPLEDGPSRERRLRDGERRDPAQRGRDPQARRTLGYAANLASYFARRLAASSSRFFGGAFVTSVSSSFRVAAATSSTAISNASVFACDGLLEPLILRTN
jgi:hypothetical protein